MDINTIIILMATTSLSTVMIIVAMFTLFNNQSKKIDAMKDEVVNLKLEVGKLSSRMERLEMKFDKNETELANTNQRTDKIEVEIKEIKEEVKSDIKEVKLENQTFMDKLFDLINKNAQKPVL